MKKYKIIKCMVIFIFSIATFSSCGNVSNKVIVNFADAIINSSPKNFICLVQIKRYGKMENVPKSKYEFISNPLASKFMMLHKDVRRVDSLQSFCVFTDSIIFLKKENYFSTKKIKDSFPMLGENKCLLILESMYKTTDDEKNIKENYNYPFINKETFFKIRNPARDNGIYLFRNIEDDERLPEHLGKMQENKTLVEDIRKLSSIFCDRKKYEFLDGISDIQKIIPSLQTDIGKQIAEKMIEILEKKIIDTEFPKKIEKIKKSPKLNLEAVEKLYKENKK